MAATPLALKTAIRTNGCTRAIKDGSVTPSGVRLDFVEVNPIIAAYRRMVRDLEFDVCEMAPTTYLVAREFGKPFTAIPVFFVRQFHHNTVVYNTNSGLRDPKDLEGKKGGVRAYTVTAGVWTRGVLKSEYGVDHNLVTWVTDDEEHVQEYVPPPNSVKAPPGRSLADMIVTGEIAVALSGMAGIGRKGAPSANWDAGTQQAQQTDVVRPLFPNAKELETEWYRRTNIFPIHGLVVIRNSLLEARPEIAADLYSAFKTAKEVYLRQLQDAGPANAEDPGVLEHQAMVGGDPLPFGVESSRETLEALVEFAHDQKIISTKPRPEELFAPATIDLN